MLTSKTTRTILSSKWRHRWTLIRALFNEYTENTTIHGVKYLAGNKTRPEKIYWIVIFVSCFIFLGCFIHATVTKWRHNFVILVEDDTPTAIHRIPFPAITICPQVKIRKSEFSYQQFYKVFATQERINMTSSAYQEYFKKFQLAQQVCHYTTTSWINQPFYSAANRTFLTKSHIELLHKISPPLKDMLMEPDNLYPSTVELGSLQNTFGIFPLTSENFSTTLTNEGVCFTLNLRRAATENGQNQVSRIMINLNSNKSDVDTLCQPTQLGYKIILHDSDIYPTTFEKYIAINHESMTKVKVRPKMITTSESLRRFEPNFRQCYFGGERQLKFYKIYKRFNCKLECFTNYTLHYYGCAHFAFPRDTNTPICGDNINYGQLYEMVEGIESMLKYVRKNAHNGNEFEQALNDTYTNSCNCLAECNSIDYGYTATTETFHYDKLLDEIATVWNFSSMLDTPADLEFFWDSSHFIATIRKPLYTISDVVSQFGGLLGLFLGASILSFFEIIYFCMRRLFTMCARSKIRGGS